MNAVSTIRRRAVLAVIASSDMPSINSKVPLRMAKVWEINRTIRMERERMRRRIARFLILSASADGAVVGVNSENRGFASRSGSMCSA